MNDQPLLYHRRSGDTLHARGSDLFDLLARLAASEFAAPTSRESCALLLTNDKGRIVDLALAAARGDGLTIECGAGRAAAVKEWIEGYVIVDDASFDLAADAVVFELLAPADEIDGQALNACPPEFGADAFASFESAAEADAFEATLQREQWAALTPQKLRERRVRLGILAPGEAMSSGLNPLEAGLRECVSFTKGCFVGQEVVARLENYEKVRRALALIHGEGAPPTPGQELSVEHKSCGRVLDAVGNGADRYAAISIAERSLDEGIELDLGTKAAGILTWIPAAREL